MGDMFDSLIDSIMYFCNFSGHASMGDMFD